MPLAVTGLALAGTACEPSTVEVGFSPDVGDQYRFVSQVGTEVTRTIGGDTEHSSDDARLESVEQVMDVADEGVRVEISVSRDGELPRHFEVVLDRASRLSAIDLVEGVPATALGLDLGTDLPADVASPPAGPLEPGARWTIDSPVELEGVTDPQRITGTGRIDTLGVEDGVEVAVAVVELQVPVRSVVDTADGRVTLFGSQTASSRTAYALDDGALWRDRTTIDGDVSVIIEPPAGVDVEPVQGDIHYRVTTRTRRTG